MFYICEGAGKSMWALRERYLGGVREAIGFFVCDSRYGV